MTTTQQTGSFSKQIQNLAGDLSPLEVAVLEGRGGGPGFCAACDRLVVLGLDTDDGETTALGLEVLAYLKATTVRL